MLEMSKKSQDFLRKYFPELLEEEDLDHALLELDAFITREGLDENFDMTHFGHEAQAVYDDLYDSND